MLVVINQLSAAAYGRCSILAPFVSESLGGPRRRVRCSVDSVRRHIGRVSRRLGRLLAGLQGTSCTVEWINVMTRDENELESCTD
jgi:hypothetical protein